MGVIPAFDEIEDCHAGLDLGFETAAVEQFAFERGKETFAHRVIEAIADRAHRRPYLGLAAALAEGERSILAALLWALFARGDRYRSTNVAAPAVLRSGSPPAVKRARSAKLRVRKD